MLFTVVLFGFFSGFCLLSSLSVICTKNPVFSVLFLIFTFFNVCCLLFLFEFEFVPILILVIYVGAIAVLFLFVLMMLNIKIAELLEIDSFFKPISAFWFCFFLSEFIYVFKFEMESLKFFDISTSFFLSDLLGCGFCKFNFFDVFFLNSNVQSLALALYNSFSLCFLISGFALLLAMIAAIVLALKKTFKTKAQKLHAQILKDFDTSLVQFF